MGVKPKESAQRAAERTEESMNEKFFSLPEEKQQNIINAAMEVFAQNEYKRASTELIAVRAGVSKGLLFYYFHNKKELYLFLYDYVVEIMKSQIGNQRMRQITDFYEMLRYCTEEKVRILGRNPYLMEFSMRAFYSEKEEVSDSLKQMNTSLLQVLYQQYFGHIDTSRFKETVDPYRVFKMLQWMADGYIHELQMENKKLDVDLLAQEFEDWMDMMKKLTYKEEYLDECHRD
ncbi:TetR/AcrR family transcriptional regulator [Ruminococcus gauvreauii]|uniref:TetR/AcrR family transcriptional regulator n=1 Tax=Ruminococcus gauvreauii TaxID=438033 RepID=UPI0039842F6C